MYFLCHFYGLKSILSSSNEHLMSAVPKHLGKIKYKIKGTQSHTISLFPESLSVSPTQLLHWELSNCTQIDLFPFIQIILNSFQRKQNDSAEVQRLNNGHPKEGFNQLQQLLIRNVAKLPFSSICFFLTVEISNYIEYLLFRHSIKIFSELCYSKYARPWKKKR